MTSDELITPDAARQVEEVLARQLGYLSRLRERLQRRGIAPADPLMRDAEAARVAVHDLRMRLHYMACGRDKTGPAAG